MKGLNPGVISRVGWVWASGYYINDNQNGFIDKNKWKK